MVLVQLFVVALPEEFFFRGYLQTILRRKYRLQVAIPIASLLFAFSHSVIALQWWHFAIFFPALVFGWLREKTGGLVAPILFHALSNVAVFWIGSVY
ncbi:MAG: CPBP family intramembrane metalloprotease [Deltaproteobacteria bacterium]|nr:CPBP family intramembrane metalloprotease [Deltaproteobacteria bacterium]